MQRYMQNVTRTVDSFDKTLRTECSKRLDKVLWVCSAKTSLQIWALAAGEFSAGEVFFARISPWIRIFDAVCIQQMQPSLDNSLVSRLVTEDCHWSRVALLIYTMPIFLSRLATVKNIAKLWLLRIALQDRDYNRWKNKRQSREKHF